MFVGRDVRLVMGRRFGVRWAGRGEARSVRGLCVRFGRDAGRATVGGWQGFLPYHGRQVGRRGGSVHDLTSRMSFIARSAASRTANASAGVFASCADLRASSHA